MIKKLFSKEDCIVLENIDEELLLDKAIELSKQPKDIMSFTSEIIKQRQVLNTQLSKELEKKDNVEEDNDTSEEVNNDVIDDTNLDDSSDDIDSDENDSDKKKDSEEDTDNNSKTDENEPQDSKSKESKESYSLSLKDFSKPLQDVYDKYLVSLEVFNVKNKLSLEEQPVVYVKDAVLESLNNLINKLDIYNSKNTKYINKNSSSLLALNEKLTIINFKFKNNLLKFTNKLIDDPKILGKIAIPNKSNLKETSKVIKDYDKTISKIISIILNNNFNKLEPTFTINEFEKETTSNTDLTYKSILPGFIKVKVSIPKYKNYLDTDLDNYVFYKIKILKIQDLYNIDPITINNNKDLEYLLDTLDKILITSSIYIQDFNKLNNSFSKLIDDVKALIYDIEKDKFNNIKDINIDSKVKDFIKFKLLFEIYITNINLIIDYIVNCLLILNETITD